MRFSRRSKRPPRGEFPRSFTEGWIRGTLPTASPAEARNVVEYMRRKGWSEKEVAELILPYMPRAARSTEDGRAATNAPRGASVPPRVSTAWLDQNLPAMSREEIRLVVDELERRGWSAPDAALAVLPHLLPKLPSEDAHAILAGLQELGMTDAEIDRLAPRVDGRGAQCG